MTSIAHGNDLFTAGTIAWSDWSCLSDSKPDIAIAARKQPDKYLAFYFALMDEQDLATPDLAFSVARKAGLDVEKLKQDMMDKSVDASIKAAHDLAMAAKIDGTPAFIINGRMREGAINDTILSKLAEQHS